MMLKGIRERFDTLKKSLNPDLSTTSVVFEVPDFDFLPLLQLENLPVFYFKDRDEEFIGIGSCFELHSSGNDRLQSFEDTTIDLFDSITIINPDNLSTRPRILGGLTFDQREDPLIWEEFSPVHFFLPAIYLEKREQDIAVILSFQSTEEQDLLLDQISSRLKNSSLHQSSPNKVSSIEYPVSEQNWEEIIDRAHAKMDNGDLEKVVLSRICEIETQDTLHPSEVVSNLNQHYPDCYTFYVQVRQSRFFGASPEVLCELTSNELSTIALAGTRPRGSNDDEDGKYSQELISDQKEREEHQLVVEEIVNQLESLGYQPDYPEEPSVISLANVLHLKTEIKSPVNDDVSIFDVISLLHPTPALGGKPRPEAMDFITKYETHPRGMYASPVGWIDLELNGKLIVAIRSAINKARITWLYAGAGIMRRSEHNKEWDEIELKFRPVLQAMGVML